jgi:hypothetical protein
MKYLLYCIFAKPGDRVVSLPAGLKHPHVLVIEKQGLCAAFSQISPAEAAWDTSDIMTYHKIIESFFDQVTLVPFRFGTLLDEQVDIERLLEIRCAHYREILHKLKDCVEVGIRALFDPTDRSPSADAPDPAAFPSQDHPTPGTLYLAARKARWESETVQTESNDSMIECFRATFSGLFTGFTSEISWLGSEQGGKRTRMLSLYFLVPRKFLGRFRHEFSILASVPSSKLLFSGPWPPYNFVLPGDPHS